MEGTRVLARNRERGSVITKMDSKIDMLIGLAQAKGMMMDEAVPMAKLQVELSSAAAHLQQGCRIRKWPDNRAATWPDNRAATWPGN